MQTLTEQSLHLGLGNMRAFGHRPEFLRRRVVQVPILRLPQGGQSPAHPTAWRLAFRRVVVVQTGSPPMSRIRRRDLPDQVHVSVSDSQFVDSHQRDINLLAFAEANSTPECMRCDALSSSIFRCKNSGHNGHSVQCVKLRG